MAWDYCEGYVLDRILKVGVIGCGAIAEHLHVPNYHDCGEAELVAFCDVKGKAARSLAAEYAPGAKVYTDYRRMLKDGEVEAVSVCLPNVHHGPVSIAAMKAGCHVFVEKPMAVSLGEARRMVGAATKAGVLLMVNQCQRRFPVNRKAKEVLASGIMGKVLYASAMFGHGGPEYWSPTGKWFFKSADAKFGAMADLGVHKADQLRYLTGLEVALVAGFHGCVEKKRSDVDDNFAASLVFDNGALGTLGASWTAKGACTDYAHFHCANGTLRVEASAAVPLVAHLDNPACTIEFDLPEPYSDSEEGWGVDACGNFVRAALGLEEPFCTGEEGMKSLAVILAADKAGRSGRVVRVEG